MKKINKKRLFFVIIVFIFLIFLFSKIFIGVKEYVSSKNKPETTIKSQEEIDREKEKIINIAIDPAKGGINEGLSTPDGSLKEKDINMDIAKRIKANLEKHNDIKVCLTREYDENIDLKQRIENLKRNNADALISIRINAQGKSGEAQGMDTYYSNLSSSKIIEDDKKTSSKLKKDNKEESDLKNSKSKNNNDRESKTENKVEVVKKGEESLDKQKERIILSKSLAQSIQSTTLSFVDFDDRGIKDKNFDILLYTNIPSVIVQCGFISNESDGQKLQNEKTRQDISDGISDGILNYVDLHRTEILKDRVNYR